MQRIVSIHQPNLFPWLGFFKKIKSSNVFVYLDHVINNPKEAIYTKRVQIMVNNAPFWFTIPLESSKEKSYIPISEMKIHSGMLNPTKSMRTIEHGYSKTKYFDEIMPYIRDFFKDESPFISDRNINFIERICEGLGIRNERVKSSTLKFQSKSNDLLIDITKHFQGEIYLSGDGADGYQDPHLFKTAGINLQLLGFKHPIYQQNSSKGFIKGLSIVDALMNLGFEGVQELLDEKKVLKETLINS